MSAQTKVIPAHGGNDGAALVPQSDKVGPMQLLQIAVAQGADIDKLEKLMALQERWEANEAKKAYVAAMNAFKEEAPVVRRDKQNKQYNSMYVSLPQLVSTISPFLSKHGLSFRWDHDQSNGAAITVTCIVTHEMGHSEKVTMTGPADTSGQKNAIQQIKSTVTYLKAVTLESITGLASTDANLDDDGNGGNTGMDESVKADYEAAIDALVDKPSAEKLWKQIAATCKAVKDTTAYNDLKARITKKGETLK